MKMAFINNPGSPSRVSDVTEMNNRDKVDNVEDAGAFQPNGMQQGPKFNWYATKKTMAQSLMDIALLTANASQLKMLLNAGETIPYFSFLLVLISISISLQIIVAVIFLVIARLDWDAEANQKALNVMNNIATAIVFVITVANIFISAFGIEVTTDAK